MAVTSFYRLHSSGRQASRIQLFDGWQIASGVLQWLQLDPI
jgi:hypothetical protein